MASSRIYDIAFRLNGKLNSSYSSAFSRAESIADKAVGKIKNTILGLGSVVISTAAIKDFVDTYKEYQKEMYNVAATAGIEVGSDAYEKLNTAALEAGKKTTKTATESAEALNYMALAGWSVEDSVKGLMPMLRLSEATVSDLATTSDLVTDSMSAMNIEIDDMTKYLDMATAANNRSNQTSLQMMEVFTKAGGSARSLGLDMYDLGTAAGVLANNGKKGEEAGTALNSMLVRIGTNSTAMKAMDALGVSMYDAEGKARKFVDVLSDINEATSGMSDAEKNSYMSDIAGSRYYSQFGYLLDAVNDGSFQELYGQLVNSEGALDRAANTQNSSLSARLSLLQSAWDDFKINVVSKAEPILSEWISKIAGKLPDVTDKVMLFFKRSGKYIGELWDKGKALFQWAVKNKDTLGAVFAGIGGAIIAYKVVSGIAGVVSGLVALASSPVLLGILAVGAAVGAIAYSINATNTALKEASLEEHFGNISLSAKEIEDIADAIFDTKGQWKEYADAVELATSNFNEFLEAQHTVDVLNYKLSLGIELDEDDIESYKSSIDDFISSSQNYILQKGYAVRIGIELLQGEEGIIDSNVDRYFSNVNGEFTQLGTDLAETVNKAFSDGVLSEDEANLIAEKMYNIRKRVNDYEQLTADATMEEISLRYSGASLDKESYEAMLQELQSGVDEITQSAREAYISEVAMYKDEWARQQQDPSLNYFKDEADYLAKLQKVEEDYLNKINETQAKVYQYAANTLSDTYGDEMADGADAVRQKLDEYWQKFKSDYETTAYGGRDLIQQNILKDATGFFDEDDVLAMKEIYDPTQLENMLDLLAEYKEKSIEIPQEMMNTLKTLAQAGMMAGDPEATAVFLFGEEYGLNEVVGTRAEDIVSTFNERLNNELKDRFSTAMQEEAENATQKTQAYFDANPLMVRCQVEIPQIPSGVDKQAVYDKLEKAGIYNKSTRRLKNSYGIPGYASGTNYTPDSFIAGEEGAELITNSKGYRVYDALETGKMYENAAKVWELVSDSREQSRQLAVSRQISSDKSSGTSEYSFNFTMPSITINGNVDDSTKQQLKAMLEAYKNEVKNEVMNQLRSDEDRRRRVSNE